MIQYKSLKKVDKAIDEFIKEAVKFNTDIYLKETFKSQERSELYYTYMEGLMRFGKAANFYWHPVALYFTTGNSYYEQSLIYYLIDKTGLVIDYIYAPFSTLFLNDELHSDSDKYFGVSVSSNPFDSSFTRKYDCVVKMGALEESEALDIDELKDYLPLLPNKYIVGQKSKYFQAVEKRDRQRLGDEDNFGPIIYRSDSRSFYLPFVELVRKKLQLEFSARIIVSNVMLGDINIIIKIEHCWWSYRYEGSDFYHAIISYDNFEIIQIDKTDEKRELKW